MKKSLTIIILGIGIILASSALAADDGVIIIPIRAGDRYMYWQGDWVAGTPYKIGDAVHMDGSTYMCITKHTSSDHDYPPYDTWFSQRGQ